MLRYFRSFALQLTLLAIIFLLVIGGPMVVFAQDDIHLPSPVQQVDEPATVAGDNVIVNTWAAITGLVMSFLAGGIVGIAGIGILMNRLKNDQATLNAIEGLVTSAPPAVMEFLQELVRTGRVTLDVIDTVSDGQPNIVAEGNQFIRGTIGTTMPTVQVRSDPPPETETS